MEASAPQQNSQANPQANPQPAPQPAPQTAPQEVEQLADDLVASMMESMILQYWKIKAAMSASPDIEVCRSFRKTYKKEKESFEKGERIVRKIPTTLYTDEGVRVISFLGLYTIDTIQEFSKLDYYGQCEFELVRSHQASIEAIIDVLVQGSAEHQTHPSVVVRSEEETTNLKANMNNAALKLEVSSDPAIKATQYEVFKAIALKRIELLLNFKDVWTPLKILAGEQKKVLNKFNAFVLARWSFLIKKAPNSGYVPVVKARRLKKRDKTGRVYYKTYNCKTYVKPTTEPGRAADGRYQAVAAAQE